MSAVTRTSVYSSYKARFFTLHWSIAAKSLLVGLLGGILVSAYRIGVDTGVGVARTLYGFASTEPLALVGIVCAAILTGLVIWKLITWEPMASGSGIPQTEGVLSLVLKMRWWSILAVRFLGGLLGALFGLSLGREGPCVQIGACAGQAVKGISKKGGLEESCLTTAGAAAGLSAAFSAPLSGIVFSLEEVHRSFSPFLLISAATGAMVSAAVAGIVFGLHPVLFFSEIAEIDLVSYAWMIPLGLACGLLGALLNRMLLGAQRLYGHLPGWAGPVIALLVAIPVGMLVPQVMGGGADLIGFAETERAGFATLLVLLVIKLLFTCTSFGSGTPGGIFMPTLAVGALGGAAFCATLSALGLVDGAYMAEFAVCGMAGTFAGCVKTPLTGIMLTVEMTGSLSFMLPVAITAFTALFVADALRTNPVYNSLLDRYIDKHGKQSYDDDPDRLFEVAVEKESFLDGAEVSEVSWPESSVLVSVHKAWRTVVPRSTTRIRYDDYLIASPIGNRERAKNDLLALATRQPARNAVAGAELEEETLV